MSAPPHKSSQMRSKQQRTLRERRCAPQSHKVVTQSSDWEKKSPINLRAQQIASWSIHGLHLLLQRNFRCCGWKSREVWPPQGQSFLHWPFKQRGPEVSHLQLYGGWKSDHFYTERRHLPNMRRVFAATGLCAALGRICSAHVPCSKEHKEI